MTEEEFEKIWQQQMELNKRKAEADRQYYKEHPEALVDLRHYLYEPFVQRMSDQLFDEPTIEFTIVGIQQTTGEGFEKTMREIRPGSLLLLIPEPNNSYDPNAIAVYNEERKIGYVLADDIGNIHDSLAMVAYTECFVKKKFRNSIVAYLRA